jgi:hypothetical protein
VISSPCLTSYPGQSHLIFGTGSTGCVTISQFFKLYLADTHYRPPENLDAIALAGHMIATSEQEAMEIALESAYADLPEEQGFWGHEAVVHLIPLDVLESIMNWYRQVAQQKTMHVAQRRTTEQPMRAVERPMRRRGGNGR